MVEKNSFGRMFNIKELTLCALFGAIIFTLVYVLGSGIVAVTGIPMSGGVANIAISLVFLAIAMKAIDKFGTATFIFTIVGALVIPTTNFGPPGVYKVPMLFAIALSIDLVAYLFRKSDLGYILAGAIGSFLAPIATLYVMTLLSLPGADKLASIVAVLAVIDGLMGAIGMKVGLWIYNKKIKNRALIKQLK